MSDKENSATPGSIMPFDTPKTKRFLPVAIALAIGLTGAGCVGEGPVKVVAEGAGIATTPQTPKDFVVATRPSDPAYMPIGTTIIVNPLCPGDTPPPVYTPTGNAARFATPTPDRKPGDPCKARAPFKKIEAELEAKRLRNEAAGTQARTLGSTPAPKPAILPTN